MTGAPREMRRGLRSCHSDRNGKRRHTSPRNGKRRRKSRDTHKVRKKRKPSCGDRLSSLPDEILGHILCALPTKDVAAVKLSSKRLGHVFSLITSIDLDEFPASPIRDCPLLFHRFPLFKSVVTTVLQQCEAPLTRFRLRFGGAEGMPSRYRFEGHGCSTKCFPTVEPDRLNVWLSCPLAHPGLRELELTFRNARECKLPPQLFDFQSLESLRLDANIKINDADIPLICLPKLKLMHILNVVFTEDDFVTRLVSSCPALEDLSITRCWWDKFDRITIASHSLRRMVLWLSKFGENQGEYDAKRTELVTIDTPNMQYLSFNDNIAYRYSITHMNVLVEAKLFIDNPHSHDVESSARGLLSLLSAFTDVQHLSVMNTQFLEMMFDVAEIEEHLPVFRNLKTITLPMGILGEWRWDIVMLLILHSSPLLETLVFREGLFASGGSRQPPNVKEEAYLEAEGWRTNTLPSCCLTHLKRIELGRCYGIDRELNMFKFFLGKAPSLKELVLCLFKDFNTPYGCKFPTPNFQEFVSKLEELPRASNSCSIIVDP